jgi:hypothetical protein
MTTFNSLNVPDQWQQYYTKYPEGYTILEALLNWVQQVNDMVVNVNDWNTYLDDFVKTFDTELQEKVSDVLREWQADGTLEIIISQALQTEIDDISINVKTKYGAKGDGLTDDTTSIQNALNAAANTGKLYFPTGVYNFSGTLTIPSNVKIEGENMKNTRLQYTGAGIAIISGDRIVDGTHTYGTATYYLQFNDIEIRGVNNTGTGFKVTTHYALFKNVIVSNFDICFDTAFSWSNKFETCNFTGNTIFITNDQFNANSFTNCYFMGGYAFKITNLMGLNVTGCNFEDVTNACFHLNSVALVRGMNITGNYFESTGMVLEAVNDATVYGLNIVGNLIITQGSGLAFNVILPSGIMEGQISANSFIRNNGDTVEPLCHLSGYTWMEMKNNKGFTFPTYLDVPILDSFTITSNTSLQTVNTKYPSTIEFSGTGSFLKGLLVGSTAPATEGAMFYSSSNKRLVYNDGTGNVHIMAIRSGATSARPVNSLVLGQTYFDTTLNKPVWVKQTSPAIWVDATGATV